MTTRLHRVEVEALKSHYYFAQAGYLILRIVRCDQQQQLQKQQQ